MPAFPERESSILAVLKKKKPGRVPENEIREGKSPAPTTNHQNDQPPTQVMTVSGIVSESIFFFFFLLVFTFQFILKVTLHKYMYFLHFV